MDALNGTISFPACVAVARAPKHTVLWPELVFYLDAEQSVREQRFLHRMLAQPDSGTPSLSMRLLMSPSYNKLFREYFLSLVEQGQRIILVDASFNDVGALATQIVEELESIGQ